MMRHFLHRLHVRLNCFLGRYAVSGEHRYLRMRVKELEEGENQDIRFLRFQLTRLRAEKNELLSRADDLRDKFSALFCMTVEQLQDAACRYDIWEADCGPGWFVAADHCTFCGCRPLHLLWLRPGCHRLSYPARCFAICGPAANGGIPPEAQPGLHVLLRRVHEILRFSRGIRREKPCQIKTPNPCGSVCWPSCPT